PQPPPLRFNFFWKKKKKKKTIRIFFLGFRFRKKNGTGVEKSFFLFFFPFFLFLNKYILNLKKLESVVLGKSGGYKGEFGGAPVSQKKKKIKSWLQ
ncbi:hypothetical protein, partial [Staphylococcus aureus]|uniref:hypothetical protein n=1 Tax=Staphylococcus aureus TaxID=1280 RepID=UPI000F2DBF4E